VRCGAAERRQVSVQLVLHDCERVGDHRYVVAPGGTGRVISLHQRYGSR
jgi:hypothetical protein